MATRTNKKKPSGWIQREGKLGGPGYTRKSVAARRKILRAVVKKYGYRSALGSIMALERSTHISATTRKVLESDRVFLRETFGAGAKKKYETALTHARTAQRSGKTGAQQNIIVLLLHAGFKVRGDVASYKIAGGREGVAKLPKTLAEAKALVARKKRRESDVRRARRSVALPQRKLASRGPLTQAERAAFERVADAKKREFGILRAPRGTSARRNPFGVDDYVIAQVVAAVVGYLGKRGVRQLGEFNALPRDERRPKLIAALKSKKLFLVGGPVVGTGVYAAAAKVAESPRLVEHLLDLIEEYGPAAAEHASDFATTKLIRKNSLRIRTGRTATVTTYLNPAREECSTHGVPLLNGRCIPCEYEDDVGMKTNRKRK
jgi:hypothetical protein